jgi:hypothetical protein
MGWVGTRWFEFLVYGQRSPESTEVLQRSIMDHRGVLEPKKPERRLTVLF